MTEAVVPTHTTVYVKVTFLKISYIDTAKEEFRGDVYIQTRWREPKLDDAKSTEVDTTKFWNPRIVIGNVISTVSSKIWSTVQMYEGQAYIVEKRRINGVFAECLELKEYPFDMQDLTIAVTSELSDDVIDIDEDEEEISAVHVMCFVDVTEWNFRDVVHMERFTVPSSGQQHRNPALLVKCIASRKSKHFIYNTILLSVLISSLSFTTFSVDVAETSSRLKLAFVITLTGVTSKLLANQGIPKIPYLTHLDRLILGGMLHNWLISVWHAIISQFNGHHHQRTLDFWALIGFLIFFTLLHFAVLITAIVQRRKRNRLCKKREVEYKAKVDRLMGKQWTKDRTTLISAWSKRDTLTSARLLRLEN